MTGVVTRARTRLAESRGQHQPPRNRDMFSYCEARVVHVLRSEERTDIAGGDVIEHVSPTQKKRWEEPSTWIGIALFRPLSFVLSLAPFRLRPLQ